MSEELNGRCAALYVDWQVYVSRDTVGDPVRCDFRCGPISISESEMRPSTSGIVQTMKETC